MASQFAPMPTWRSLDDAAKEVPPHLAEMGVKPVSRRTLNRWIEEGLLTPIRIPGDRKHYVDLDEIEKIRVHQPVHREVKPARAIKAKPKAKLRARRKKGAKA